MSGARILLASASPRRARLLRAAGLDFEVFPTDVDETLAPDSDPLAGARELAERKARAAARAHAGRDLWIVAADTVVAVELAGATRLLGKPADEAEARRMLGWLSGSVHRVVTGVCVLACRGGALAVDAECTRVTMRELTGAEIAAYGASGEWRDKAGGYAIQESADAFVTELAGGGFDNVVGLPVALTLALLRRAGAPLPGG